jgi:aspartate carbamoyltransferase catalytic subunit
LIEAGSLDHREVESLLDRARALRGSARPALVARPSLAGKLAATLFLEPSTRTRLSFEAAMLRLGGQVISVADGHSSSATKGESLEDTVRIVSGYADAIILRHPEAGSAGRAAAVSPIPIVNAGDGAGEHPTQALLDLFTIREEVGRLDHLRIVVAGDLRYGRTVHSLSLLLSLFSANQLVLVPAAGLELPDDIYKKLTDAGVKLRQETSLQRAVNGADVLYQTRIQKERLPSGAVPNGLVVDRSVMARLPRNAIVMHPLPRVGEIDPAVDEDPRAAYFRQAANGLYTRMAVLEWVLAG